MRTFLILILFNIFACELIAQDNIFRHDWDFKYLEHNIQFTSKRQAPVPFSVTGEPQAIMIFGSSQLDSTSQNDLEAIVEDEIEGIRNELCIDEYLEEDYIADDNIVSYFDKIDGVRVAVIKYRTNGIKGSEKTMTRSTRHMLFIHNGLLYVSSLIVLYAEDSENMRSDQITFIKKILAK